MSEPKQVDTVQNFATELVAIDSLRAHPRNYRVHPADEIEHLCQSIKEHGIYRNIVIAREGTILAGHGVWEACKVLGLLTVPVIRLDLDPSEPRALKVLAGDNEIGHLSEIDDRRLADMLKEIKDTDITGLLGTGYDEMMLANLVFVTRPAGELTSHNEAAEWVGMPGYEAVEEPLQATISFRSEVDRLEFARLLGIRWLKSVGRTQTAWWPPKEIDDTSSIRFAGKNNA